MQMMASLSLVAEPTLILAALGGLCCWRGIADRPPVDDSGASLSHA